MHVAWHEYSTVRMLWGMKTETFRISPKERNRRRAEFWLVAVFPPLSPLVMSRIQTDRPPLSQPTSQFSQKSRDHPSRSFTFTFWRKQNRKRNTQHCKCKKCLHLETRFLEQLESWTKEVSVAHLEELGPNHLPTGNCFNLSLESKTVYNGAANNLTKLQEKICTA